VKRALVYVRVSSREQADEGYSIPAQSEACSRYVTEHGWCLVDEYCDRGESARTADRPAFQAMLERIREDPSISYLVVHKLDRLARNLEDHAMVRAMLRKHSVKLVSVSESLEDSASGKLVEGILASMAEFYSANLAQEIKKGLLQKVQEGGWPTIAPLGYRNVRMDTEGRRGESLLVADEEAAPLVRKAFELYATGEWTLNSLHEEMTRLGLRNRRGGILSKSKLAELLKNRAYIGKVVFRGVEYEGKHDLIVPRPLFDRVQDVFSEHDYAGVRIRRQGHYLRGVLYCGGCGQRLSSLVKKERYEYFYCLGKNNRRTECRELYARARPIERQVEEIYETLQIRPEVRRSVERDLRLEVAAREKDRGKGTERAARRLQGLASERDKLLRAYYADAIPLEMLKKEQARIDGEVEAAEAELKLAGDDLKSAKELIEHALRLLSNCHRAYKRAKSPVRKRWNRAVFERVYVKGGQITEVVIKEPFACVLAKGSLSEGTHRESSSVSPQVEKAGHYSNRLDLLKELLVPS